MGQFLNLSGYKCSKAVPHNLFYERVRHLFLLKPLIIPKGGGVDTQTDTHTDILTYLLIEPGG